MLQINFYESDEESDDDSSPQVHVSTVDTRVLAVRLGSLTVEGIEVQESSWSTQSISLHDIIVDRSEVHETTQMILRLCDSRSDTGRKVSRGSSAQRTLHARAQERSFNADPFREAQRMLSGSEFQRDICAAVQEDSILRSMIQSLDNGKHTIAGAPPVNQSIVRATHKRGNHLLTVFENIAEFLRGLWASVRNSGGRFASCLRTAIESLMQCIRDAMRIVSKSADGATRAGRYVLPAAAAFIQTCVLVGNAEPIVAVCSMLLSLMAFTRQRLR